MRHIFIINPVAGKHDRSKELIELAEPLMTERGESWEVKITAYRGHATQLAAEAAETGEEVRLYACGGDGTLNEVVNGAAGFPNAAVTHFPTGSGNDFIKLFGHEAARFFDLRELLDAETASFDLIDCNSRLSINICSVGLDARIGHGMTDFKRLPGVGGSMAYQLSLISNVIRGIHQHYRVTVDGEAWEGPFTLLCACNGQYYGGGFHPAPDALPDDGLLDFLLVKGVSRLTVAKVVGKYAGGLASELPDLITLRRGHCMEITCQKPNAINLDGERLDGDTIRIAVSDKKIRFFYPRGARRAQALHV